MSDTIGSSIISARTPPAPEQVAEVIIKQLFRNDLNAAARLLARTGISTALKKWKDQLLERAAEELADARRETRDQMMRADEAILKYDVLKKST